MATTLVEYSKLSNDVLMKGIIETLIYESETLDRLPFIEVNGNALTYNRENAAGGAQFYNVGDTWVEGTPTFTQATANLTIMGGDADIDAFVKQTRSNIQDIEAETLRLKIRDTAFLFDNTFVNGSVTTNPKSFDGLINLVNSNTMDSIHFHTMGAAGAALTLAGMDKLCDSIKGGRPDLLIMSKMCRRALTALARASGTSGLMSADKNDFGKLFQRYNDIPISINDWQSDVEEYGASGATCNSIYAVRFGEDGLCGLTNGWITHEDIGQLETKDATRHRIKWYTGLALFNIWAAARLGGIIVS